MFGRFAGSGLIDGGVCPGLITVGDGDAAGGRVGVADGEGSSSGVGEGVAVGDGLGFGVGVGVGVRRFALALALIFGSEFVLKFAFILKLKLLSKPRLVLTFVFSSELLKFVFTLRFSTGLSFCRNQKPNAPSAIAAIVPMIVSTTTFAVLGGCGGG